MGRSPMHRVRLLVLLVVAALLTAGCAPRKPPVLRPLVERSDRTPVVLVPGVTGSQLRERETGRVVWGRLANFFWPRDGGYSLAVPINDDLDREDPIESFAPVLEFRPFGVFRFEFYSRLVRTMESNDYRTGDLKNPRPGETFFIFDYDWRYGNVRTARELAQALERLRLARGQKVLEVHFICQSNAGRIVRYFLKYGGASLEDAEAGRARPPERIRTGKLILVGSDNGGALGTLQDLNRGRKYLRPAGRRFLPETVFTFESLFEALPIYRDDLFFDEIGKPLEISLFQPETWQRYGWSVFDPRTQRRIRESGRTDLFGEEEDRVRYLRRVLDRALRTHRLLVRDVEGFGDTRLYFIQNAYIPTGQRSLLKKNRSGRWKTIFSEDPELEKDPYLLSVAATAGDHYATLDSQLWVSPQERAAIAHPPVYIQERHRDIIRNLTAHRWIMEFLAEP